MHRRQKGAVLIISLLFLTILTILGLASVHGSVLQERMAFNSREQNLALQAAEAALRDGELWLLAQKGNTEPPAAMASCSSNCYAVPVWTATTPSTELRGKDHNWWSTYGRQHGQDISNVDSSDLDGSLHIKQPYYLVQMLDASNLANNQPASLSHGYSYASSGPYYYRISSYGVGKTRYKDGANDAYVDVLLQSIFSIITF